MAEWEADEKGEEGAKGYQRIDWPPPPPSTSSPPFLSSHTRPVEVVIATAFSSSFPDRLRHIARMHRKNIRALSLIICTFTYLLLGAAVFDALESDADMRRRKDLEKIERRMKHKYQITEEDYQLLETVVIKGIPHQAGLQWRFAGAFYFATLVITTVGYGHSTPATTGGKAFCILYALAGIPLGLVMFQRLKSIGERLNALISALLRGLKRELGLERELTPTHLILVSFAVGSAVICFGTYVFHRWEGWTLFDAYYYCMITLTTVGFGDFVALQKDEKLNSDPAYVIFTLVFILFGLAVFSASVNLFVLRFMATGVESEEPETEPAKRACLESLSWSGPSQEHSPAWSSRFSSFLPSPSPPKRAITILTSHYRFYSQVGRLFYIRI